MNEKIKLSSVRQGYTLYEQRALIEEKISHIEAATGAKTGLLYTLRLAIGSKYLCSIKLPQYKVIELLQNSIGDIDRALEELGIDPTA